MKSAIEATTAPGSLIIVWDTAIHFPCCWKNAVWYCLGAYAATEDYDLMKEWEFLLEIARYHQEKQSTI